MHARHLSQQEVTAHAIFACAKGTDRDCGLSFSQGTGAGEQGLPPGWTQACYPVLPPGVTSHRNLPRRVDDAERLEVNTLPSDRAVTGML